MALKNTLPSHWSTKKFVIQNSTPDEIKALMKVYHAHSKLEKKGKKIKSISPDTFIDMFSKNLIQLKGTNSIFHMQSIYLKESSEIIGYFHLNYGIKDANMTLISALIIDSKYQNENFFKEIILNLVGQIKKLETYKYILTEVKLINKTVLAFWINSDFRTILDFKSKNDSLILGRKL